MGYALLHFFIRKNSKATLPMTSNVAKSMSSTSIFQGTQCNL